ncbi:MAG: putative lipid II flippase FtsW [Verrucomicrobia bacterium]|nr:MAG: putative lipid II flippase FtsW [Verrucomicrobiota bacterium]
MKYATTILVFCVAGLLSLGLVMLYSSSMSQPGANYPVAQVIWCGVGLTAGGVVACVDYRHLKKISLPLFLVAIALLALVLVPSSISVKAGGARRWLSFAHQSFQPSELVKLALVILLAHYAERHHRVMPTFGRGLVVPGVLIGLTLGLIFLEPDWGTALLLATVSGIMLLVAGVRWRHFFPPLMVGAATFMIFLLNNPVRMKRILSWMNPEQTKEGVGYQAWQAMLALGSGGWTGLGLGNGRQKFGYLPEHQTDFILANIGEELGLIATLGVLAAFVVLLICGIYIAWHSRDTFGLLLATGLTFLIALQAFINIGVVTSALPNKGLPLPFISRGGSNLCLVLVCVGLLLSVARRAADHRSAARHPSDVEETAIPQTA